MSENERKEGPSPTRRVELTLIRHGESTYNVTGRWQGHGDAPLSDRGREQARRLGERLAGERFDRLVSSDLSRARETAEAIGQPLELRPAWREIHVGRWEGLTRAEVAEKFPDEVKAAFSGDDIKIGGGESWGELSRRVRGALHALLDDSPTATKLGVVAHGGVIASLVSGLLGFADQRPRPLGRISNTAVTHLHLDVTPGTGGASEIVHASLARFNDASHALSTSAWTVEMEKAGFPATILVSSGALPQSSLLERVTRVDHLGDAAGAKELARALGVSFGDRVAEAEDLDAVRAHIARASERTAVVAAPSLVARVVGARMRHDEGGPASVRPPTAGTCTSVIVTTKGKTFADYGAGRPGP